MKASHPLYLLILSAAALLASCGSSSGNSKNTSQTQVISASSVSIASDTISGDFTITTDDGTVTQEGAIYTISSAGTYVVKGKATGMIYVNAGDEDAVEIDLEGASLSYGENSPIFVANADEVKIKAKKGTENFITDTRAEQTTEDDSQGPGAIYAKADLKLVGQGSLTVMGTYNNGVHTSKDLKIKNQTLTVIAPNNAIKGNDSIEVTSGTITAISTAGDALKTTSTDLSSSSKQRGTVTVSGGTLNLYAGCDGIDAAYNIEITNGVDEDDPSVTTIPTINILTNKFSSYSDSSVLIAESTSSSSLIKSYNLAGPGGKGGQGGGPGGGMVPGGDTKNTDKAECSAKGLKAANGIYISGGVTVIQAYDDGIHANSGDAFESGSTGVGAIEISGGQTTVSASDDGVHADGTLSIKGGTLTITDSHEGIEAKNIAISGGTTVAYASDDAANASSSINVSGGYLFACVPASGDTDGIDSNGTYKQTGGTVVTCGPNNMNSASLDVDGSVNVSGGTFVAFGYVNNLSTSLTKSTKSGSYGNKAYTLKFASGSVQTETLYSGYSSLTAYSELGSLSSIS